MKTMTSLFCIFLLFACKPAERKPVNQELPKAGNKLGIGLIHFNLDTPIPLYRSEADPAAYDTLKFVRIAAGMDKGKCSFRTGTLGNNLRPYILSEGDSDAEGRQHTRSGLIRFSPELVFRVMNKTDSGFTVMINEETASTSFVRTIAENDLRKDMIPNTIFFDPNFVDSKISNWFYYETWQQALERAWYIGYDKNEVYNKPGGTKITPAADLNQVDSVQGDWIRLRERYNDHDKDFGWVKWRENDRLKVEITLNGGYD